MIPLYYVLDCIPAADGRLQIIDVHGGVGAGLDTLAAAYGGRSAARARLQPYLQRLGEVARGKRILFIQDLFTTGHTYPDDFFELVQRHIRFCPITDWVPDLEALRRRNAETQRPQAAEQMGVFLDPLAGRLRLKIGYCEAARIDSQEGHPMLLLSGYRERGRQRGTSVILPPEEIGVALFSGPSERFPDGLKQQPWFPLINPPLLDRLLENRWMVPALLEGTPAARLLPRWIPVGMGFRTASEVKEFAANLPKPAGFPLAVLKPSHTCLSPGVRFLDHTALRALAARQPAERIPARLAEGLLAPRVIHSYEEVTGYRGKQLDNLLRTPGAEVHDHGDGTFHFSAPYPFLESTVALLQEYVECRPIRSRRTGRLHRGHLRVVVFGGQVLAALYHLEQEPDDGTFRDVYRESVPTLLEAVPPSEEAEAREALSPFLAEVERQFAARVRGEADLQRLRAGWVARQAG